MQFVTCNTTVTTQYNIGIVKVFVQTLLVEVVVFVKAELGSRSCYTV